MGFSVMVRSVSCCTNLNLILQNQKVDCIPGTEVAFLVMGISVSCCTNPIFDSVKSDVDSTSGMMVALGLGDGAGPAGELAHEDR